MVKFNFSYDANVTIEQRIGFELAGSIWASFLTDDVSINLHIGARNELENDKAVGGAVPLFHEQNYGVFKEYLAQDATDIPGEEASPDEQAVESLQTGNTVDLLLDGEVIDGNSEILLTSAQAKALGMDEAITLNNGTTWDRDLIDPNALDGFIVISNNFDWDYDFARSDASSGEGKLDFLSMALHEIGHSLGFVSGIDGSMDVLQLHSGETRIEDFTVLDLLRHTTESQEIENADGSVSSVSTGGEAYLSFDGGKSNVGDLATGMTGDDSYQASHWKRMQVAMGIMDPTLGLGEKTSVGLRDLQAMDVLGWDVDYKALNTDLDIDELLRKAEQKIGTSLGLGDTFLSDNRTDSFTYDLGFGRLFQIIEQQMRNLGYDELSEAFELGFGRLFQQLENADKDTNIDYAQMWEKLEDELFELGFGRLFQEFEEQLLELGFGRVFQMFELGFGRLFQELDPHIKTLQGQADGASKEGVTIDKSNADKAVVVSGGNSDDILGGGGFRDLISGGGGDDLIDGKAGDDSLLGEDGNDILYGWEGNDKLYGGAGDDLLIGEAGEDKLYGEEGHDILSGGYDNDLLDGGAGRDQLRGDAGNDVLDGGVDNDDVDGGEGNDIVIGGEGEDSVSGGDGDDVLYGDQYFVYESSVGTTNAELPNLQQISEQAGFTTSAGKSPIDFWVRLETEDFKLENFNKEEQVIASGNSLIATGGRGEAKTKFSGPTGVYDIIVGYYDEKDGKGELKLEIGDNRRDKQKFEWELNEDLHNDEIGTNNFTTYTIRGVELKAGEEIKLKGDAEGNEFIRVDYLDIISTTNGTIFADSQFYNGSFYVDSKTKTSTEAAALQGEFIAEAEKNSAEAYWLNNALGTAKNIIKVDVSDSQFNMLLDDIALDANKILRMEAEDFSNITGQYKVEGRNDFASGKKVISSNGKGLGQATTAFTGEAGVYDIFVSYVDQGNKQASASFGINGQTLNTWNFDTNTGQAEYRAVGSQVSLKAGDTIQLQGWADSNETAQIDYVDFVKVADGAANGKQVPQLSKVRIEAENASWAGGDSKGKEEDYASGQELIETKDYAYTITTFNGESGLYNIVVGYDDEGKGKSQFSVALNGNSLGFWSLTEGQKDRVNNQTLTTEVRLNQGDQLKFQTGKEKVKIDYIDFTPAVGVSAANLQDNGQGTAPASEAIFLEAEYMTPSGKAEAITKDAEFASGNGYVKLDGSSIATRFTGETGYYDIVVGYYDIAKGNAELAVKLNGDTLDQWRLDALLGGDEKQAGWNNFVDRTVASGVKLTRGTDVLQILNTKDGEDKGYVDYIKLVKVDPPGEAAVNTDQNRNSDIMRGGKGNDTIYGGDGNDLIYGEDEFDNGLGSASNTSDTIYGGDGNDKIYGNSGNDIIEGGSGDDKVVGGIGDDRLDGSDSIRLGAFEKDILNGGSGSDTFVLGSSAQSYYISDGNNDYALIEDFDARVDVLQLHGSVGDYRQWQHGDDLWLLKGEELIAVLNNNTRLDLSSANAVFVG